MTVAHRVFVFGGSAMEHCIILSILSCTGKYLTLFNMHSFALPGHTLLGLCFHLSSVYSSFERTDS